MRGIEPVKRVFETEWRKWKNEIPYALGWISHETYNDDGIPSSLDLKYMLFTLLFCSLFTMTLLGELMPLVADRGA